MMNYYDMIAKQDQADRRAAIGYRIPTAARREVSEEAVARHLGQKCQLRRDRNQAAKLKFFVGFANTIKAVVRNRTALVR